MIRFCSFNAFPKLFFINFVIFLKYIIFYKNQVDAILIKILDLSIPASSYSLIILLALSIVAFLSKLNLASTSVEIYPYINLLISTPKFTAILSIIKCKNSVF